MKILVACEESQAVTIELRRLGHEAYSCDIEPCSGGHLEWHIQADVLPILNGRCDFDTADGTRHNIAEKWNMIVAHPPCTFLTLAGNKWFNPEYKDRFPYREKQQERSQSRAGGKRVFKMKILSKLDQSEISVALEQLYRLAKTDRETGRFIMGIDAICTIGVVCGIREDSVICLSDDKNWQDAKERAK